MNQKKTVLLALGAAASLFCASLVVGACQTTSTLAQEENTMMNSKSEGGNTDEACNCAEASGTRVCKNDECKGSCGGEGLNEQCAVESLKKN